MKLLVRYLIFIAAGVIILGSIYSCNKKSTPTNGSVSRIDKNSPTRSLKKKKLPTPKVIVVNDSAAKRTPDGRFYYDLNGKRYWRNKKDGKYYLFNKAMYESGEF